MPETAKPSGQGAQQHDLPWACSLFNLRHPLTNSGFIDPQTFSP